MYKRLFIISAIFFLPVLGFSQSADSTFTFTAAEIDSLFQNVRELEVSDSLKTIQIEHQQVLMGSLRTKIAQYESLDSLQTDKIDLLNKRLNLKDEHISLLEKKIRRNRLKYILMGVGGGLVIGLLIE